MTYRQLLEAIREAKKRETASHEAFLESLRNGTWDRDRLKTAHVAFDEQVPE